jgi:hypothetical protein
VTLLKQVARGEGDVSPSQARVTNARRGLLDGVAVESCGKPAANLTLAALGEVLVEPGTGVTVFSSQTLAEAVDAIKLLAIDSKAEFCGSLPSVRNGFRTHNLR